MKINRIPLARLWSVATLFALGAVASWRVAAPTVTIEPHMPPTTPPAISVTDTTVLGASAAAIEAHNPFRIGRTASDLRFDPMQPVPTIAESAETTTVAKPSLVLVGILGGPPWNALVDGIPEYTGSALLRLGEQANGIRFEMIHGDTIVLTGLDTTWTLTTRSIRQ